MTFITTQPKTVYRNRVDAKSKSALTRFIEWAEEEDAAYHIAWVGALVTSTAAVFFPLTMTVILLNGAAFGLIIAAMVPLSLVVITNLAAMPVKYTLPFFIAGVLADIVIMLASFLIK